MALSRLPHGEAPALLRENRLTAFPHFDIPDDGPPLLAALCTSGRDDPKYRWRRDHGPDGLLVGGPKGEQNPLQRLQSYTFCAVTASTPDAERKQQVTYKGRVKAELRADHDYEPPRFAYVGKFTGPRKPATSGRRKQAA